MQEQKDILTRCKEQAKTYPEGHPELKKIQVQIDELKRKEKVK